MEIYNTKQELKDKGVRVNPLKFFAVIETTGRRGYNKVISVYVASKDGTPYLLGTKEYQTASCLGEYAEAKQVIKQVYGYKMKDSYHFVNSEIEVTIL